MLGLDTFAVGCVSEESTKLKRSVMKKYLVAAMCGLVFATSMVVAGSFEDLITRTYIVPNLLNYPTASLPTAGIPGRMAWDATKTQPTFEDGTSWLGVPGITVYIQTITPAAVSNAVCAEQTFTVTGLQTTDRVFYNPPATGNATSSTQVRVSAANTLAVTYCNPTAGSLTPAAGTAKIMALRAS